MSDETKVQHPLPRGTRVRYNRLAPVPWRGYIGTIVEVRSDRWGGFSDYLIDLDDTPQARVQARSNGWRQRTLGQTDEEAALADLKRHNISPDWVELVP